MKQDTTRYLLHKVYVNESENDAIADCCRNLGITRSEFYRMAALREAAPTESPTACASYPPRARA